MRVWLKWLLGLPRRGHPCLEWLWWLLRREEALRRLNEWGALSGWEIVKWDKEPLPFHVIWQLGWPHVPFEVVNLYPSACRFHVIVRDAKAGGLVREGWVIFYLGYPKYEMHWKTDWCED